MINLHPTKTLGDSLSAPSLWFDLDASRVDPRLIPSGLVGDVIIGGGVLLSEDHDDALGALARRARVVVWGAGLGRRKALPGWLTHCALAGVRDHDVGLCWVPDASCMSEAFNKPREPVCDVVVFEDIRHPIGWKVARARRANDYQFYSIGQALDFLGSGAVVITSSYHGAYWATLLGRMVVALPSANAHRMRHPPVLSDRGGAVPGRTYLGALDECREANREFYRRVVEMTGSEPVGR